MDQDPYHATKPLPARPVESWVIEIPGSITRPIKYMWLLLAFVSAISAVGAIVLLLSNQPFGNFVAAALGLVTCLYLPLAVGIYKRFRLVAVGTLVISVIGLLGALLRVVQGDISVPSLAFSGVMTFVSIRGTIAIYAFHRLVADARRRPPGPRLSDDPAFKQEA